jgi:hypothetical protein
MTGRSVVESARTWFTCRRNLRGDRVVRMLIAPSNGSAMLLDSSKVGSNLHQLVQFRGCHRAVEEPELTGLFHLVGSFEETGHCRAVQ